MFYDVAMNFVIGTLLIIAGAIMVWIPNRVFAWILSVSILFLLINGCVLLHIILCVYVLFNELSVSSTMDLTRKLWGILYFMWNGLLHSASH